MQSNLEEVKGKNITYVSWNYGKNPQGGPLHLVRTDSGRGALLTTEEITTAFPHLISKRASKIRRKVFH